MRIYNLTSGSKANATLVACDGFNILIDAGGTKKYLKESLNEVGYTLEDIDMVLVTHFHTDHCKALNCFSNEQIYSRAPEHKTLQTNKDNDFFGISIRPFELSHDDPCLGYQIKHNNKTLTYITDTGYIKNEYIDLIKDSDYLYLEFNHDIVQLNETYRPAYIKKRILSDTGHLNNQDAALVLLKSKGKIKQVIVAHISEQANTISAIRNAITQVFDDYAEEIDFEIQYAGHNTITLCGDCDED